MPDKRQIATVHLTARGPAGEVLAVASYTNGRCGVTRDGEPIAGLEWPPAQMIECTAALVRLAGLKNHP